MPDGDFMLGLHNDSSYVVEVMRVNADGTLDWTKDLPSYSRDTRMMGVLPNGNGVFIRFEYGSPNAFKIYHLAPNGDIVFNQTPVGVNPNVGTAIWMANTDMLFATYNGATGKTKFQRTDNQGNILWELPNILGNIQKLIAFADGGFGYVEQGPGAVWRVKYFTGAGMNNGVSPDFPVVGSSFGVGAYADGALLVWGKTLANRGFLQKLATDGTIIWAAESPEDGQPHLLNLSGAPTADGWAAGAGVAAGNAFGFLRVSENSGISVNTLSGMVAKDNNEDCVVQPDEPNPWSTHIVATNGTETFQTYSNQHGEYTLYLPAGDFTLSAQTNELFFFLCPSAPTSVSFPPQAIGSLTLDFPMQSLDLIHQITGKATLDQNDDCIADPGEPPPQNWNLRLTQGTQFKNVKTNNAGEYQVFVTDGDFSLEFFALNQNFDICGQSFRQVSFSGGGSQTATEDFVVNPLVDCAMMRTQISASAIRPCSTAHLTIGYRNDGTIMGSDATLDVTLDPALEFVSAQPAASISGNIVHFDLGDVPPMYNAQWNTVKITVLADCSLQIGQQVCVGAAVTPDVPCNQAPTWQGAIIAVDGSCVGDSAVFKIRNIGNGPQVGPLDFIIAEDQIVLLQGNFNIAPGAEEIKTVFAPNSMSTYSIAADQEPGSPSADTLVTYSLTNCQGMGGGAPSGNGGNSGMFSVQACINVVNSYDPNDKNATPLGYGPEHYVRFGTPLDYTIRFQNTGNDTAFRVVLRDTLSGFLDYSKIEALASSHLYEFSQINDSILHISFENIVLPDSATNPEASQGFITFQVYPKPDLPQGTPVDNRAAIYFDQNPPIITNTVRRVYGEYLIVKTDDPGTQAMLEISIAPNPFISETSFQLPENAPFGPYQLVIFEASGKGLKALPFAGNTCRLRRENLPSGLLFWKIMNEGKMVASGKIVAGE